MIKRLRRIVLVDLDGTLADTYPDLVRCAREALERFQIPQQDIADSRLRPAVSGGAAAILKAIAGRPVEPTVIAAMLDMYAADPVRESRLFAGAASWFNAATVAVVTNKSRRFAATIVNTLCPSGTLLVCPEDAGASKPDPAPLLLALSTLGVSPEAAVYVGDDLRDYEAAAAAGIEFIAALYGYGNDFRHLLPDGVKSIRQADELARHIAVQ